MAFTFILPHRDGDGDNVQTKSLVEFENPLSHWDNHNLKNLYQSDILSDCQIVCDTHIFHGHVCVLASACKYVERAFCGGFKEAESRKLDFSGDD
ncbi:Hypothetical protein D9617_2g059110 [Elsinoe fawcettii]|nr:Hypothetical protein D9617_2g059110 [Elsinoe fawcettii]